MPGVFAAAFDFEFAVPRIMDTVDKQAAKLGRWLDAANDVVGVANTVKGIADFGAAVNIFARPAILLESSHATIWRLPGHRPNRV